MNSLKIYTQVIGADGVVHAALFPNDVEPAELYEYEYTAERMGTAPQITGRIKHTLCLDKLWTERQYVEFRGEKYFVRETPSSKKNNADARYEHEIVFKHERSVLETIYMVDSVYTDDAEKQPLPDKYFSNSTKVVFWGNVREYVERLNACLYRSKLQTIENKVRKGYQVVIDADVKQEDLEKELLVSFDEKFFSEAIQEIFAQYNIPYYWVEKVCHVGYSSGTVSEIFEYGAENNLLSIEKNNTNEGYCNRATGYGSSDNIPIYYPNLDSVSEDVPHALPTNKGITDDAEIKVIDETAFEKIPRCTASQAPWTNFGIKYYGADRSGVLSLIGRASSGVIPSKTKWCPLYYIPQYYMWGEIDADDIEFGYFNLPPEGSHILADGSPVTFGRMNYCNAMSAVYRTPGGKEDAMRYGLDSYVFSTPHKLNLLLSFKKTKKGDCCIITIPVLCKHRGVAADFDNIKLVHCNDVGRELNVVGFKRIPRIGNEIDSVTGEKMLSFYVWGLDACEDTFYARLTFDMIRYECYCPPYKEEKFATHPRAEIFLNDRVAEYDATLDWWYGRHGGIPHPEKYELFSLRVGDVQSEPVSDTWQLVGRPVLLDSPKTLADFGLSSSQKPQSGDVIIRLLQVNRDRLPIQERLRPTIYRQTKGEEQFYNALNNPEEDALYKDYAEFYKDDDGKSLVFENEFEISNPRESVFTFDDIKPSIKGIKNINNIEMGSVLEVMTDDGDHDFLVSDSVEGKLEGDNFTSELSSDSEYEHPYFFVKIPRTTVKEDSGYNFNLFKAAAADDARISMTSGACGGCSFRVMVLIDEKTGEAYNPVIVDKNTRRPIKDAYGRVRLLGTSNGVGYSKANCQQDTSIEDVWICLEKEADTYGVIMPNATAELRPTQGDTFVFLNIALPVVYIRDAEDRLSVAVIKAMLENNSEKFDFSMSLSQIYMKMHPEVARELKENSSLFVMYNGQKINLYATSYSFKITANSALPEISVELSDTIVVGNSMAKSSGSGQESITNMGGNGGVYVITTNDTTTPSDVNVYSAKRTDKDFLNKNKGGDVVGDTTFQGLLESTNSFKANIADVDGKLRVGEFVRGTVGAQKGIQVTPDGTIVAKSLMLEDSLIVPSITYNKAITLYGICVISPAVGKILYVEREQQRDEEGNLLYQEVDANGYPLYTYEGEDTTNPYCAEPKATKEDTGVPLYSEYGWITLDLEDGESGSIREGDMLLGFWNNVGGNSENDRDGRPSKPEAGEPENTQVRNGDFELSGFSSVYFLVEEIGENEATSSRFKYSIRHATDNEWNQYIHPTKGMDFYGIGNMFDKDRQSILVITREYSVRLINKNWWTYDYDNIISIEGKLDGFAMRAKNNKGEDYIKWFEGYGRVGGNEYIFGHIDQFERVAYRMEVQLKMGGVISPKESEIVTCVVFDGYGNDVTQNFKRFDVTRDSGDKMSDKMWNAIHMGISNPFTLSYSDINVDGVTKKSATFKVAAYDEEGNIVSSN